MENAQIAGQFEEIADLLELQDANQFRVRSYRDAARSVRNSSKRLEDLVAEDADLTELPNVGQSTADKIREIVETGTCKRLEQQRRNVPAELTQLMQIPGLGPRTAMQLYKERDIKNLKQLTKACENHQVRELKGLGPKTEESILEGIKMVKGAAGRMLYYDAESHVESVGAYLDSLDIVQEWVAAGSFRRRKETVGDLDILLSVTDREETNARIAKFKEIDEVIQRGKQRTSVRLTSGLTVDFRYFDEDAFGSALLYFTGSKAQ